MIAPFRKGRALLDHIDQITGAEHKLDFWWLGQSGYLVKYKERFLLFDPYLSDSLTKKYARTDKPHVRMSELVIDPAELDFIEVVTSSHNHTDHLDAETLLPIMAANPTLQLIVPEANRTFVVDRLGCNADYPTGLNAGESVTVKGWTIHGIPAAHNDLERDELGRFKFMGYVVEVGPFTLYHSGDTLWHEEIIDALEPFQIDVAMLPINGNKPERRVAGNLDGVEAAKLAKTISAKIVTPCHYDMFTFNTADPTYFSTQAESIDQPYVVLEIGQHWTIEK
ncbi:MAG: MBL fold metallo-hydrolase [Saprospiraceae bacterium]|nr:MBL fold metallo-hydrolase [Saprospiraceae bacterium]